MSAQEARDYEYDYDYRYTSSAAPKREETPVPAQKPKFEVHRNPNADSVENTRFWKDFVNKTVACVCVCAIILLFTGISRASRESANHDLEVAKGTLTKLQQANTILAVELDAIVAKIDIDRYATEELGLVKVSSEHENYLVNSGENRVLFSSQKQ